MAAIFYILFLAVGLSSALQQQSSNSTLVADLTQYLVSSNTTLEATATAFLTSTIGNIPSQFATASVKNDNSDAGTSCTNAKFYTYYGMNLIQVTSSNCTQGSFDYAAPTTCSSDCSNVWYTFANGRTIFGSNKLSTSHVPPNTYIVFYVEEQYVLYTLNGEAVLLYSN